MDSNVEKFANLDIRVGRILSAEVFEEANKPAYILKIYARIFEIDLLHQRMQ